MVATPWRIFEKRTFPIETFLMFQLQVDQLQGKCKQDGRLAPAYFSQEHKYFDQHLPTVKNETIVQNLFCESFLQTSIPPLIFYILSKRGVSRLFVQNFLSHSTKKFRWGRTLRCIRKFRVAKNFMHQRGGGGYQVSSSKTFCHTVPKNFVREHFGVSENFVHRKILCIRRGYHSVEKSLSHSTDEIRRRTLLCCVSKESWYRKVSSKGGGKLHGFVQNFFISQDRKNFAMEPFCVSENFW